MCYPGKRNKLILQALERVEQNQFFIIKSLKQMATEVDNLAAAVANDTAVDTSAIKLLIQLSILIKNAASTGDLAKVQQLADNINANSAALAAAIVANTPVVATPPPVLTDKTYTDATGVSIVISQAGATPVPGEVVTSNGAPLTAGETFTVSDGAVIVIGDDSKVVSYTAAPAL